MPLEDSLQGRRLRAHRSTRQDDGMEVFLVEDRPGVARELPAWMCDAAACSRLTIGPPLVAVDALIELSSILEHFRDRLNHFCFSGCYR